jgi:hypothetical protein
MTHMRTLYMIPILVPYTVVPKYDPYILNPTTDPYIEYDKVSDRIRVTKRQKEKASYANGFWSVRCAILESITGLDIF